MPRQGLIEFLWTTHHVMCRGDVDEGWNSVITAMLRNKDRLPPFHFDCGLDDPLFPPIHPSCFGA